MDIEEFKLKLDCTGALSLKQLPYLRHLQEDYIVAA
jgi:hypothetical protein